MTTTPPKGTETPGKRADRNERQTSGPPSVLCVGFADDDPLVAALDASTEPPVRAEAVGTGRRALDRVAGRSADVSCLVTEHSLEAMTGLDLLAGVREQNPELPVVLVADDGSERLASEAISAGVTDYFRRERLADDAERFVDAVGDAATSYSEPTAVTRDPTAEATREETDAETATAVLDADGAFSYLTEAYADVYGYDREDLLGESWELLVPDGQVERLREEAIPEAERTGSWSGRTTGLRADGRTVPERRSLARTTDGGYVCTVQSRPGGPGSPELHEREQTLRELTDAIASTDRSTRETVERILELGCERFGLPVGMLTRERGGVFRIVGAHGSHPEFGVGDTLPASGDRYCQQVVDDEGLRMVTDTAAAGWADDPLFTQASLQCYAGIQLSLGGETFGTVCFAGTEPRPKPFSEAERTFLKLLAQCVCYELEQRRKEEQLATLHELTQEPMEVESPDEVCGEVVRTAAALNFPATAVALHDRQLGELELTAATDAAQDLVDAVEPLAVGDSVGWQAFAGSERVVESVPESATAHLAESVTEVAAFPLGTHGVLVAGTTRAEGFRGSTLETVETVAATTRAALDRTDRERQLQERERRLAEKNEALERLNRVNDTIRSIDRALVSATSREEIEAVTCEQLASTGAYELAWVGEVDRPDETVRPREVVGDKTALTDGLIDDDESAPDPVTRASQVQEPVVVNDIVADGHADRWRQAALRNGYHACIALPLVYQGSMYGVLAVYADRPGVFDDFERSVLVELSDTIAHAVNAVESKRALVTDEVVELVFDIGDTDVPTVDLAEAVGGTVSMESVVRTADGRFRTSSRSARQTGRRPVRPR